MNKVNEITKGKKILIVDDNEDTVLLYRRLLNRKGFNIIVARTGEEALIKVREENPHLMLLDLGLPKLDGYDICEMIKSSEKTKMIPVIIITCHAAKDNKLRGYKKGADDYITKPVIQDELVARIYNLLKKEHDYEQATEDEKLKTLVQVAVRVNHDINNPLCTILANAELLRASAETHENNKEDIRRLDLILKEVDRIKHVVLALSEATQVISTDYVDGVKMLDLERSIINSRNDN